MGHGNLVIGHSNLDRGLGNLVGGLVRGGDQRLAGAARAHCVPGRKPV